ncbi:MAG: hypothetical protein ACE5JQ_10040 [Candidatus Methylomirabilales bacterium]
MVVHILRKGDYAIFGCSYGTEPREIRPGWWRAAGIAFYRQEGGEDLSRRVLIKDSSEAEPDLEYSVGADRLSFILYTYDPREPNHVPFAKESYRLSDPEFKAEVEILLKASAANRERVNELFRVLALPREQAVAVLDDPSWVGSRITQILYELRNYGIRDPKGMLQRLKSIGNRWWRDGHAAESLSDIKAELKLVEQSRKRLPER